LVSLIAEGTSIATQATSEVAVRQPPAPAPAGTPPPALAGPRPGAPAAASAPGADARGSAPAPIIRLRNVRKAFGTHRVLEDFSLDVEPARTTVLLGPSGSGKSVLLKHVVGLLRPDAGEVWFDDQRVDTMRERDLRAVRLRIGFLFQMAALFDSMSVEDNIAFPLVEHTDLTRAQRRDKVHEALRVVDLAGVERKLPSELSGGQRKRVALARAIVLQPKVVLYDEPTTGLDPIRSGGINDLIVKLKREMSVTGIVVTHDLGSARAVADRVVMLLNGRLAFDGAYDDLARSPDARVRQFVAGAYAHDDDEQDEDAKRP
jgi:phospholipid/cholesterol/gamma-HCH transport system ATP-binding protein